MHLPMLSYVLASLRFLLQYCLSWSVWRLAFSLFFQCDQHDCLPDSAAARFHPIPPAFKEIKNTDVCLLENLPPSLYHLFSYFFLRWQKKSVCVSISQRLEPKYRQKQKTLRWLVCNSSINSKQINILADMACTLSYNSLGSQHSYRHFVNNAGTCILLFWMPSIFLFLRRMNKETICFHTSCRFLF